MDASMRAEMDAAAREFVNAPVSYTFTNREKRALAAICSNIDRKIFFLSGLPESVIATVLAMYSRLKNSRGLRGHIVDNLIPVLMFAGIREGEGGAQHLDWRDLQKMFRTLSISGLDAVCNHSPAFDSLFESFVSAAGDPEYWRHIATSKRIQDFKNEHLDRYGHNSIIRPARLILCVEQVSILVAKIIERTWPGTAFIELSTRYVDFSGKSQYPIWNELGVFGEAYERRAKVTIEASVEAYRELIGANFDGPFPNEVREWASSRVTDQKDLNAGVIGESCDVLGNLLPCATLTELGLAVSGEAMGELLKHLRLENSPECVAVAQMIQDETVRAGHGYFLRHCDPTPWERSMPRYIETTEELVFDLFDERRVMERLLLARDGRIYGGIDFANKIEQEFERFISSLQDVPRGEYDKLPELFRVASVMVQNAMSFRGWRDLQRQSLSVHARSRVTPLLGFYTYPKFQSEAFTRACTSARARDAECYASFVQAHVPAEISEYPLAMGNLVMYQMTSDLRQAEFCAWQRTKWGVNDEVRQRFLSLEHWLRTFYPWWARISRADMTPHYVFARGVNPVVLA